jgi:predicted enzyme related to lactoylglutathione lyase
MPRVIHFEIHADDPDRARKFYGDLFGWEFSRFGGPMDYWIIRTGSEGQPGIDGGIMRRMGAPPVDGQAVNAYVCTVDVDQLDQALDKALAIGATPAAPKMPIPGIGWLAYVKDPEGNIFGMMQADPTAG